MTKVKKIFTDHPLLIIVILFACVSCFAIMNAAPLITKVASPYTLWTKQLFFYILSAVIVFIIYYIGNDSVYDHIELIYYICLFLLFLLAFDHILCKRILGWTNRNLIPFAHSAGGATSWFNLPGFSLQPSEFMKIIIVIYLAKITKEYNDEILIRTFQSEINYLLKVLKIIVPPILLILLQNDTGVVLIILVGIFFVVFSSGLRKEWFLFIFGIVALIIGIGTYLFLFQHDIFTKILPSHQIARLYGWIDPEGTIGKEGFQLFYSLLSYGSAGLFGHGFQAVVKNFPEAQTDFIFAVITTDYGFIGGFVTIALIVIFDVIILRIGLKSTNDRDKYFTMGIFGLLFFQQVWNIGMILGLLPITGITLPFISYGGSSLLSYMLTIGMFLDIEHQNNIVKNKQKI